MGKKRTKERIRNANKYTLTVLSAFGRIETIVPFISQKRHKNSGRQDHQFNSIQRIVKKKKQNPILFACSINAKARKNEQCQGKNPT